MVATTDCLEKSKPISGKKVSKPLMEKKRRARINKCLDQLKSLLESYYSTSIRKRKLEKADILELTVKHLRSLQKIQSCSPSSDYQSGFRSCLANVNQYLLLADGLDGRMLSQLCGRLSRRGAEEAFSTTDSGAQGAAAAGAEERTAGRPAAPRPLSAHCSPGGGARRPRDGVDAQERSCSRRKLHTDEAAHSPHSVWRPW